MIDQQKKILIISYYAGIPGACQSEWLDDKIDSFVKGGKEIALVSGPFKKVQFSSEIKHSRVPSISFKDFREELGYSEFVEYFSLRFIAMWPLVLTFGLLSDLLSILVTRGIGEGRWSWIFSSFIPSLWRSIIFRPDVILSTGGPASAHIVGILTSKIIRRPIVLELQDPLSGDDIGRNPEARGWLYKIEKFLVYSANKIVYVTKSAADFAKKEFVSEKVFPVYPGARNFDIPENSIKNNKLKLVHLGSLYASRNFKSIISAIDSLISEDILTTSNVELINLGHVAPEIRAEIIQKSYVKILPAISRVEALKYASSCDMNLLIQNNDQRSRVTIPYKTYDYLNLQNTILALLNSEELTDLIRQHGHIAVDLNNIQGIADGIKKVLNSENQARLKFPNIDPVSQALDLITL